MKKILILIVVLTTYLSLFSQIEKVNYLDEVEVSAMREKRLLKNSPEIIRIITKDDIARYNYRSTGEVLSQVAGVNIETGTGSGQPKRSTISLNGYPAQYTLVLVDGNRILSDHIHTGQNIDLIPVENIERIEIINGAASAQYGSDALAGIVNIITKSTGENSEALIYADGGSYNSYHAGISVKTPINKNVSVYSFTDWEESDGLPLLLPASRAGKMQYTHLKNTQKISFKLSDKIDFDLACRFTKTSMVWQAVTNYSHLFMPDAVLKYKISDKIQINAKAAYTNWYSQVNAEHNFLFRPEIWANIKIGENNRLLAGTDFSQQYFTRSKVLGNYQNAIGLYVQDEHKFGLKLHAQLSVRLDKVENLPLVVSPKFSLLFCVIESLNVRAVIARGFHAPSLLELYEEGYGHAGTAYRFGNPDLKPEYSTNFSLGAEWAYNNKIFVDVSGFYSVIENMIVPIYMGAWDENPAVNVWMRQNILKADILTGELGFRWYFANNYGIQLNYTYSENTNNGSNQQLPYQPGQSAGIKIFASQSIGKNFTFSEYITCKAVHGRSAWNWKPQTETDPTNPLGLVTELEDFQKLDAGISLTIHKQYEIFVNLYNILGQDIQNLDDALTQIAGEPYFNCGLKIKVGN